MIDVVAGMLLRDGKVLLGLRKAGGQRGGLWEMPGGKVDSSPSAGRPGVYFQGETHAKALVREWREELGIDIIVGSRIAVALLDLEICFTVTLYEVFSREVPKALDHVELRWVEPQYAIEVMPCFPAMYEHWPAIRAVLQTRHSLVASAPGPETLSPPSQHHADTPSYRCTTPMCGESGVCDDCRRRGAR